MSHELRDHGKNNINKDANVGEENERRVDQLIDIVDKHTRTERHLEQHSDIASLDQIKHTLEIQEDREAEISNLRNIIAHGKGSNTDDLDNVERNYEYTSKYLEDNANHMDSETLSNTIEKQENRRDQIENHLKR